MAILYTSTTAPSFSRLGLTRCWQIDGEGVWGDGSGCNGAALLPNSSYFTYTLPFSFIEQFDITNDSQ